MAPIECNVEVEGKQLIRTRIIEYPSELSRVRPLWEELYRRDGGTMFQSFVWNETAARVFASREAMRIVVVDGAVAAIVPACMKPIGNVCLIGESLFDYRDVLCSDPELLPRAWEVLAGWQRNFDVTALRSHKHWGGFRLEPFAKAPAILHDGVTAEQFLSSQRRLGRHSRRLRKHGLSLHRHSGANRALIETIYQRKGNEAVNLFNDRLRRDFMAEICSRPESRCEVFTYETAGELVAALVTFRDDSVRRFYTTYFDERWASLSPGQLLLFEVAADALAEGLDCDFMTGEYPYKMRLATDSVQLYRANATPEQLRELGRGPTTIAA